MLPVFWQEVASSLPTTMPLPIWAPRQVSLRLSYLPWLVSARWVWFMRSKTLDKIALKKNITSKVDRSAEEKVKVGDIGVTTTRLALIGYAEINGDIVEVKSSDGFLNEKTPIIVDRIADGVLLVERLKQ